LAIIVAAALILLLSVGCEDKTTDLSNPPEEPPSVTITAGDIEISRVVGKSARSAESTLHEAFYHVFQAIYEFDAGINSEIKYIAVDITEVFENEREPLLASLQSWSASNGYELLVDTYEGLAASGLIVPPPDRAGFMEGLLFSFYDASFDGETLTVQGMKYRGPLAAVAAMFTARFVDSGWIVEEPDGWMMA